MDDKDHIKGKRGGRTHATHRMSKTRIFSVWNGMTQRTTNPKHKSWCYYGGRGITVCHEWLNFEVFYDWALSNGYEDNLSINRIDNDKGYSPDNCNFVTRKEQMNNQQKTIYLTCNEITQCLSKWSNETGINADTIRSRINAGWSDNEALNTPVMQYGKERRHGINGKR